jgi:hypothetical protein
MISHSDLPSGGTKEAMVLLALGVLLNFWVSVKMGARGRVVIVRVAARVVCLRKREDMKRDLYERGR